MSNARIYSLFTFFLYSNIIELYIKYTGALTSTQFTLDREAGSKWKKNPHIIDALFPLSSLNRY